MSSSADFKSFILKNKIVSFFKEPVTLASGRKSNLYVNWRSITEDVWLFDELVRHVLDYIVREKIKPDVFFGVPEGGTKLGLFIQYYYAKAQSDYGKKKYCLPMGRGKSKDHGAERDRFFIGVPSGKIAIIEDVATTGDSLISAINIIHNAKTGTVTDVIVLTDRKERRDDGLFVREKIEEMEIKYHAMSEAPDLCGKNL